MPIVTCGRVKEVRTMKGDCSVIEEVACRHDDLRRLRLRRQRRDREGERRQAETGQEGDLVVDQKFLRDAAGHVGRAGIVLDDQLDRLARDGCAVLGNVELRRGLDLPAGRAAKGPVIGRIRPILTVCVPARAPGRPA
jgi:hypothetical protein